MFCCYLAVFVSSLATNSQESERRLEEIRASHSEVIVHKEQELARLGDIERSKNEVSSRLDETEKR